MNQKNNKDEINKALIKKAKGYTYKEVVEEYSIVDEQEKLTKKKVTTKNVPPDITAAKVVLETLKDNNSLEGFSDEKIAFEIDRITKLINNFEGDKNES